MKTAGESARAMARERRRKIDLYLYGTLGVALLGLGVIGWLMSYNWKMAAAFGLAGSLILMVAMIGVFLGIKQTMDYASGTIETLKKREKHALKGADGEVEVAQILEEIAPGGHLLFNDVKTSAGNIDHVLLTEQGHIYLIETKAHHGVATLDNGVVRLNGRLHDKDFVKQVLANLSWLKPELDRVTGEDAWVNLLLVFTNAYVAREYRERNIVIINKLFLKKTLTELDQRWPKVNLWPHRDKIAELFRCAKRK